MTQPTSKRLVTEAAQATALAGKLDSTGLDAASAALVGNPASTTGAALSATFAAGVSLPDANGTDDTTAIQAMLTTHAGKRILGKPGQVYKISAPLVLSSGTTLDMHGATVQLKAGSNCNMLTNAALTAARTVMDAGVTVAGSVVTLTSATAAFVAGDVGKTCWVYDAGVDGRVLKTTIASVTNATTAVLAATTGTAIAVTQASIGPRDSRIAVRGGTWDRGANGIGGTQCSGNSLRFRRCDQITVEDVTVLSTSGKYAINFADVTEFTVERATFDTKSDGVHLNGPIRQGIIRDIRGTTLDDVVSLTPNDWTVGNDVWGDITDVIIEDIQPTRTDNTVVKILGGSSSPATAARRITARNIGGYTTSISVNVPGGIALGDDTGESGTTGGVIDDILIENVYTKVPNGTALVSITGRNTGRVTIDGFSYDNANGTIAPISVNLGAAGVIPSLVVRNGRIGSVGNQGVFHSNGNAAITSLVLEDIEVGSFAGDNSHGLFSILAAVASAQVRNINVRTCTGGPLVQANAALTRVLIDGISLVSTANASSMLWVNTATAIPDVVITNINATVISGSAVLLLNHASASVTRATMSDIHWNGGILVAATTSTQTLPTVVMANVTLTGGTHGLGDLATTTALFLSNMVLASNTSALNMRATANITLYGGQNVTFGIRNIQGAVGYVAKCKSLGLPVDVSLLNSNATGDSAYNTNAGLGCGVGLVVYNGTTSKWVNLATGATT